MSTAPPRRPLRTRSRGWPRRLSGALAHAGVSPNVVSVMSIVASALAAAAYIGSVLVARAPASVLLVTAAGCVQLRLLTNMLDGLIAVEAGKHTALGDLYNEIPDRIDDLLILGGAGVAVGTLWGLGLGIACAVLAVITAYVRLLAGSLGLPQPFLGPMAKPHRMAALTVATLGGAIETAASGTAVWALGIGLGIIATGTVVTVVRRVGFTAANLRAR